MDQQLERLSASLTTVSPGAVKALLGAMSMLDKMLELFKNSEIFSYLACLVCGMPHLFIILLCPCYAAFCLLQIGRNKFLLFSLLQMPAIGALAWWERQRLDIVLAGPAGKLNVAMAAITVIACFRGTGLYKKANTYASALATSTLIITCTHDGFIAAVTHSEHADMRVVTLQVLATKAILIVMQLCYLLPCVICTTPESTKYWEDILQPTSIVGNHLFLGIDEELHPKDFPELPEDLKAVLNERKLDAALDRVNESQSYPLLRALRKAFMPTISRWFVKKVMQSTLKILQICLLYHFVGIVGGQESAIQVAQTVFATFTVGLCYTMLETSCRAKEVDFITVSRGAIGSRMNRRILQLPASPTTAPPTIPLFNMGIEALPKIVDSVSFILSGALEGGLALYYLNVMVGVSRTLPTLSAAFILSMTIMFSMSARKLHTAWFVCASQHLQETFKVIYQLPVIKMATFGARSVRELGRLYNMEKKIVAEASRVRLLRRNAAFLTIAIAPAIMFTRLALSNDTARLLSIQRALYVLCMAYLVIKALVVVPPRITELQNALAELTSLESLLLRQPVTAYIDFGREEVIGPGVEKVRTPIANQKKAFPVGDIARNDVVETIIEVSSARFQRSPNTSSSQRRRGNDNILIQFENLSVASEDGHHLILKDIDIRIRSSKFYMIIGTVGSGKTTLINALVNEAPSTSYSTVNRHNSHIGFCAQTPWLPNSSIRDCIIGPRKFDAIWYAEVIMACHLELDIAKFERRDKSLTGVNGCLLAHSQAQKVALARAIYGRPGLIVLDDIFSSIDRETAHVIFDRLFGEDGLMRTTGSTVILATHCVEHHERFHRVFELRDARLYKVKFSLDSIKPTASIRRALTHSFELAQEQTGWKPQSRLNVREWMIGADEEEPDHSSPEVLDGQRRHITPQRWLRDNIPWHSAPVYMFSTILMVLLRRYPEICLRVAFGDDVVFTRHWLLFYTTTIPLYLFSCMVVHILGVESLTPSFAKMLYKDTVESIVEANFDFVMRDRIGSTLSLLNSDANLVSDTLPSAFGDGLLQITHFILDAALVCSGGWHATAIMMALAVSFYGIQQPYLHSTRHLQNADATAVAILNTHLSDTNGGVRHIRNLGWGRHNLDQGNEVLDVSQAIRRKLLSAEGSLVYCVNTLLTVASVALMLFGAGGKNHSPRRTGLAILNLYSLGKHFVSYLGRRKDFEASVDAVGRMKRVIDLSEFQESNKLRRAPESWPYKGQLEMQIGNASFWPNPQERRDPGLSNIKLFHRPGDAIGIFGRSGSGKKSIVLSILKFMVQDQQQAIVLDGIDIGRIAGPDIRRRITVVTHIQPEFTGTIRDHLIPPELTDAQRDAHINDQNLQIVLEKVSLWQRVAECGGLDAMYYDAKFSQGEKQMMGWARALLHKRATNSQVLLAVSATNDMDYVLGERMIHMSLNSFNDCTKIILSHRLEALHSSVFFELDNGTGRVKSHEMLDQLNALQDSKGKARAEGPSEEKERRTATKNGIARKEVTSRILDDKTQNTTTEAKSKSRSKLKQRIREHALARDVVAAAMPESVMGANVDRYAEASGDTGTDIYTSEADHNSAAERRPRATLASEIAKERAARSAANRLVFETESEASSGGKLIQSVEADGSRRVRRVAIEEAGESSSGR